jgi:hypothetical protein
MLASLGSGREGDRQYPSTQASPVWLVLVFGRREHRVKVSILTTRPAEARGNRIAAVRWIIRVSIRTARRSLARVICRATAGDRNREIVRCAAGICAIVLLPKSVSAGRGNDAYVVPHTISLIETTRTVGLESRFDHGLVICLGIKAIHSHPILCGQCPI